MDFGLAFTYHRFPGLPEKISREDRRRLRDLAKRVDEIASLPVMAERRELWKKHNALGRVRPLVLVFPEGAWQELLPESVFECEGPRARSFEASLRSCIYHHEHFHDDTVIEQEWVVAKAVRLTGWGLEPQFRPSTEERGAWRYVPVLNTREDIKKLKLPEVMYDEAASEKAVAAAQELFGDILDVRLRGVCQVGFHLMHLYVSFRGLDQAMLDMYDAPEMIHETMAFFEDGYRCMVQQYVDMNLLGLNNDGTYHSSGGVGYTDELPKPDYNPERVRPRDMWASAEVQEMAQVSPEMHNEFALQYEKRLLEPFGLNGYGCCEDLTRKLDYVLTIPNIRRISIAPWADVDQCGRKLSDRYIRSWKPNPSYLAGGFNPEIIRDYIQRTLDAAKDCVVEIILKDTHTCQGHPERFDMWTAIARELVEAV